MSVSLIGVLVCLTPLQLLEFDSGKQQVVPVYQKECVILQLDEADALARQLTSKPDVKMVPNPYRTEP